jgi:hypothetical protein
MKSTTQPESKERILSRLNSPSVALADRLEEAKQRVKNHEIGYMELPADLREDTELSVIALHADPSNKGKVDFSTPRIGMRPDELKEARSQRRESETKTSK